MCVWIKHELKANNVLMVLLNLNHVQAIWIHFQRQGITSPKVCIKEKES